MSDELRKVISRTHTWMGDAIKVALTYPTCFWKKDTFNGTAFSAGPLVEIHDHSDADNKRFALNGFLDGRLATKSSGERLTLVLGQLQKYHGDIVHTYIDYVETVWSSEDYTSPRNYTPVAQHQNHGHPLLLEPLLDNRLYIAGTETSTSEAGYMEGAVRSAHNILQQLKSTLPHTEDVS